MAGLSKKDGGLWGIEHMDKRYSGIIEKAVSEYQGIDSFHWEEEEGALAAFAKYAVSLIFERSTVTSVAASRPDALW